MDELKKLKNRVAQWEPDTDGASYCMACENLYALISAAERERELVEALREADEALRDYACATDDTPCIRSKGQCDAMCGEPAVFARQSIARALQAKEAGE